MALRSLSNHINSFAYSSTHKGFSRSISNMKAFKEVYKKAKHVIALTGAGISAESGIPTFRGEGGLWKNINAQSLATPKAFQSNPTLVWEFYNHRRELVGEKVPNPAHIALAEAEKRFEQEGKKFLVITQNIDELHRQAGTKNLLELHGTLYKTQCMKCGDVAENRESPICSYFKENNSSASDKPLSPVSVKRLPSCKKCHGLLRPYVVWFGETLDSSIIQRAQEELAKCDLCLIIGTSSVVYPAALFAPEVLARGGPVAEFNLEKTSTYDFQYHFAGYCGSTLPKALALD